MPCPCITSPPLRCVSSTQCTGMGDAQNQRPHANVDQTVFCKELRDGLGNSCQLAWRHASQDTGVRSEEIEVVLHEQLQGSMTT
eukprot:4686217-Amphidinium_carterae.1